MKEDEAPDPVGIGPLGAEAEVAEASDGAHPVEKFGLFVHGREAAEICLSVRRGWVIIHTLGQVGRERERLFVPDDGVMPKSSAFASLLRSYAERFGRISS